MWNEAILEKFPEEENEEPFHASPAETENTGKTEVHGGTVETSHGCSAQSDGARKNTHHTDAGIGSSSAGGAKGYRWLESEMVKHLGKEDGIDRGYYDAMVDAAVADISQYGDFEWFVSDDPYVKADDDTPPWFGPGEPYGDDATAFDVR